MKRRSNHLIIAITTFALCLPGTAVAHQWQELGPDPIQGDLNTGRVSAIACSTTTPDFYFAAGADGGVWRTRDGGISWTPVTGHLPTLAMGALAIGPTDDNIVYAGSGEANYANHSRYGLGLFKSVDAGDTWQVLAADVFAGRCFSKIQIDPLNTQRLFASITRAGGFPELAAAKGHPMATGPVGVFRSLDGGVTWTHLLNGLPNLSATDVAVDPVDPNNVYACIGRIFGAPENGIYKSTDGGDSWVKLTNGLPSSNVGRISMAIAPSLPSRLYTLIAEAADASGGSAETLGGWRSDDSGQTWTEMTSTPGMQATYGWFLSVVSVRPGTPDWVFMGGLSLHRSTNGGASWSTITPPHVDMHAVTWDAGGRLLVGDDGGVHRSSNAGTSFAARNFGLGTIQCYAGISTKPDDETFFLVGQQDNGSVRRDAAGDWFQVLGGDGGWTQIDQSNSLYAFVEFQGAGNLYRSSNGGTGFSYVGNGISTSDRTCFLPPHLIDPSNPTRVLYATQRIWQSTNRGSGWAAISGDLTGGGSAAIRALAMAPSNPQVMYAATNDGRFLRSEDGGTNWTPPLLTNLPGWPRVTREIFVDPSDAMTVYLAGAEFGVPHVRRSRDGGQTWETLDGNLPDLPVNVVAVDVRGKLPIIFAGTDAGVYRTINDGATWHRMGQGMPNAAAIDFRLETGRGRLVTATQGRGVWILPIGLPGDLNGDGLIDNEDIDAFVLGLTNPSGYQARYPTLDPVLQGDLNGDGALDNEDIDPFVSLLSAP